MPSPSRTRSSSDARSGGLPRRVVVIGVEGAAFAMGDPVTPAVAAALDEAARAVLAELEAVG